MFEIKPVSPEVYRQKTRRSTLYIAVTFAALALLVSGLAVGLMLRGWSRHFTQRHNR